MMVKKKIIIKNKITNQNNKEELSDGREGRDEQGGTVEGVVGEGPWKKERIITVGVGRLLREKILRN